MSVRVEGVARLTRAFARMAAKGRPAAALAVNSAAAVYAGAIRGAVPKRSGRTAASVGFTSGVGPNGEPSARAGVNVGTNTKSPGAVPGLLGTRDRTRKAVGGKFSLFDRPGERGTGSVTPNGSVPAAIRAADSRAAQVAERTAAGVLGVGR
ncbi:hypothetical protein [Alienimonas sp. DA493]|uniref:hypothetical protein n=1 Tax=Alienimonas sp. DA493 TaxID=3373605 RepID=UPI003753FCD7